MFRGFRFPRLGVFSDALLDRQAWRLIVHEDYLLDQVMKAKYYAISSFLESALGPVGSYFWRSIWGSKSLVKEGLCGESAMARKLGCGLNLGYLM